tara:strand:+ start:10127 stop:10384 length:258 start_codon:yes stop_codon:yes gene_type:complete
MLDPQSNNGYPLRIIITSITDQYQFRKKIEALLNRRGINTQLFSSERSDTDLGIKADFINKEQAEMYITTIAKIATQDGYEIVFD